MAPELPLLLTLAFLALVFWVVTALAYQFHRCAAVPPGSALTIGIFVWLGVPALLSLSGAFTNFSAIPPRVPLVVIPAALATIVLARGSLGTSLVQHASFGSLIGLQSFRFPLEIVLHQLHTEGQLPVEITYLGRNFDILTGIAALLLWLASKRAPLPRALVLVWAVGGLLLLINVVTIAVLAFPQPFGWFQPPNKIVAYWPWIWLPTVLVQAALFGHLVVLRKLWAER